MRDHFANCFGEDAIKSRYRELCRLPAQLLRVFYVCPRCSHEWDEEYSCACDSECPECNLENIEADRWEDIDATPETEAKD